MGRSWSTPDGRFDSKAMWDEILTRLAAMTPEERARFDAYAEERLATLPPGLLAMIELGPDGYEDLRRRVDEPGP